MTTEEVRSTRSRTRDVLAGTVGVALLAAGGLAWSADRAATEADTAADALAAARTRVPALLSYDAATLDADLDRAVDQAAGEFRTDYATILEDAVRPAAEKRGISTTAVVTAAGVVDQDDDRVVVLVFLTQTTSASRGEPVITGSRVEVAMTRDDNNRTWRIAGLTPM